MRVNSKDDDEFYVHCLSKVIEHPVFSFFGAGHKKYGHCEDIKMKLYGLISVGWKSILIFFF